jgi:hypothetical protein
MQKITKDFLRDLISEAIKKINNGVSKTLTARKSSEIPPQDTRHLTDTRTRVSTLLEYSLSYELNCLFVENKNQHTISNVLWNVFPDLVVRNKNFEDVAGLEVKALHSASEEKSANLHTPLPLIRKGKDFIVILAWGWTKEKDQFKDIIYPHIHDFGIFDAWLIAKIRDSTWLINDKGRIKGIDISTPIINSDGGGYKAEERNLGKLMRISMSKNTSKHMPSYDDMQQVAKEYEEFKSKILLLGLIETMKDICWVLGGTEYFETKITKLPVSVAEIGCFSSNIKVFFVSGRKRANSRWSGIIPTLKQDNVIVHLGNKLDWEVIKYQKNWTVTSKGKKPDIELKKICDSILESL